MFYYRCKYVLDFYIVLFLSLLSQAVVFNKIFNLLYKQLVFIYIFFLNKSIWFPYKYKMISSKKQQSPVPNMLCYLAEIEGMLTKLFIGGSGLILRPAQPPFLCHKPLEGRTPSQRLRPALPMICLLWSTLDTRPTVTMQVSATCVGKDDNVQLRAE